MELKAALKIIRNPRDGARIGLDKHFFRRKAQISKRRLTVPRGIVGWVMDRRKVDGQKYSYDSGHYYLPSFLFDENDGWHIVAGCRVWRTFAAMRSHYSKGWRRQARGRQTVAWLAPSLYERITGLLYGHLTKDFRKEAVAVERSMRTFAARHNIKLAGESHAPRIPKPRKARSVGKVQGRRRPAVRRGRKGRKR